MRDYFGTETPIGIGNHFGGHDAPWEQDVDWGAAIAPGGNPNAYAPGTITNTSGMMSVPVPGTNQVAIFGPGPNGDTVFYGMQPSGAGQEAVPGPFGGYFNPYTGAYISPPSGGGYSGPAPTTYSGVRTIDLGNGMMGVVQDTNYGPQLVETFAKPSYIGGDIPAGFLPVYDTNGNIVDLQVDPDYFGATEKLTQRGQNVTQRGQQVTMRGQNLDALSGYMNFVSQADPLRQMMLMRGRRGGSTPFEIGAADYNRYIMGLMNNNSVMNPKWITDVAAKGWAGDPRNQRIRTHDGEVVVTDESGVLQAIIPKKDVIMRETGSAAGGFTAISAPAATSVTTTQASPPPAKSQLTTASSEGNMFDQALKAEQEAQPVASAANVLTMPDGATYGPAGQNWAANPTQFRVKDGQVQPDSYVPDWIGGIKPGVSGPIGSESEGPYLPGTELNGTLWSQKGDPKVYVLIDGFMYHIPSPHAMNRLFPQGWKNINAVPENRSIKNIAPLGPNDGKISEAELEEKLKYMGDNPVGANLVNILGEDQGKRYLTEELNPYEGQLFSKKGDTAVYIFMNGEMRWIPDPYVFNRAELDWGTITPLDPASIAPVAGGTKGASKVTYEELVGYLNWLKTAKNMEVAPELGENDVPGYFDPVAGVYLPPPNQLAADWPHLSPQERTAIMEAYGVRNIDPQTFYQLWIAPFTPQGVSSRVFGWG